MRTHARQWPDHKLKMLKKYFKGWGANVFGNMKAEKVRRKIS
jgi:hypothetical protein